MKNLCQYAAMTIFCTLTPMAHAAISQSSLDTLNAHVAPLYAHLYDTHMLMLLDEAAADVQDELINNAALTDDERSQMFDKQVKALAKKTETIVQSTNDDTHKAAYVKAAKTHLTQKDVDALNQFFANESLQKALNKHGEVMYQYIQNIAPEKITP